MAEDSRFGVESLEETIASTSTSEATLSRTSSNSSSHAVDTQLDAGKKRKNGRRVHPSIIATGQRIISSDRGSSLASPLQAGSPPRDQSARRASGTSLANMSQPLTPLRLSPRPESTIPSEIRSGSPKSLRLSDEESSIADEGHSQAVLSSSGDEEGHNLHAQNMPQLVMPSLAMPIRRPFTELGRRMGRARILVVGPKQVGKSSLIQSLFRTCEHIVHIDQVSPSIPSQSSFVTESSYYVPTTAFTEIQASTRPYPTWWTDFESRRMLLRRASVGDGVLDRNLTFIDTPGIEDDLQVQSIRNQVTASLDRTLRMECMTDAELVNLLSGDGGVQIDAAIYVFAPDLAHESSSSPSGLTAAHQELLQFLSKTTNLIPIIGRADAVSSDALYARKTQLRDELETLNIEAYTLNDPNGNNIVGPLAISTASEDDADEVDASVLMSSQYMKPLIPSDLAQLANALLFPDNVDRMRHVSATKFLLWRRRNLGQHIGSENQAALQSPSFGHHSRAASTGSLLEGTSKVLVPHSTSSYYRSASPALSEISAMSDHVHNTSSLALAKYNEQAKTTVPFRQIRLAKWAQDLQRSLGNERRKYHDFYSSQQANWASGDQEKNQQALVSMKNPEQGRLGGDLGVIDPRDPLGVLAFGQACSRQGFVVLQVAASCGLLGAMFYWAAKNWHEIQHFLGLSMPSQTVIAAAAIPPPSLTIPRPILNGWFDDSKVRGFFGWSN
ncbi:Septin-7 [Pseudocercospora fuligena]|uniref:Septin-7 n=1 Tax=Pseudocercospora fuligena TaxID=685502 RepID=A0A8H6VH55_9PEZI|nr:Septin-7 [Pseudocercospora fuligena]